MAREAPVIVWFRRDLRLTDNPALTAAARTGRPLIALFVQDSGSGGREPGAAARWWLNGSLAALTASLAEIGISLILRRGSQLDVVCQFAGETGACEVFWNRIYDVASVTSDAVLKSRLQDTGVAAHNFKSALLWEPQDIHTAAGTPFKVFTAFWRAANSGPAPAPPAARPSELLSDSRCFASEPLESLDLYPGKPDWGRGFTQWHPGETGAQWQLNRFIDQAVAHYASTRNYPGVPGTSCLSPHLHFGEVSPRQIWASTQDTIASGAITESQGEAFLRQLGWRDFNSHLLFHNPGLATHNHDRKFDGFPYVQDQRALRAWQIGMTGYPLVDAGMRQLWATGWMHNRVRMLVASFLTKHLCLDWREGEAWFWDTLVDADHANNIANWQWVAGCGADAAPYFRIFNPVRQGELFDPHGEYVRRWVPELSSLPDGFIHRPWLATTQALEKADVPRIRTYPLPIVDHQAARARALKAYHNLGNPESL